MCPPWYFVGHPRRAFRVLVLHFNPARLTRSDGTDLIVVLSYPSDQVQQTPITSGMFLNASNLPCSEFGHLRWRAGKFMGSIGPQPFWSYLRGAAPSGAKFGDKNTACAAVFWLSGTVGILGTYTSLPVSCNGNPGNRMLLACDYGYDTVTLQPSCPNVRAQ